MKKLVLLFIVSFTLIYCQPPQPANEENNAKHNAVKTSETDGVFIHISHGSEDAHRVAMGLKMATMMAEDKDVLVYFDINGIDVVTKHSEDITMPAFPSAKESLQKLIENNVPVYACPGCMKAKGVSKDDLVPGVQVAEKEAFFNFTKGRILTLDY